MKPVDRSISVAWKNEPESFKVDIYKSIESKRNYYCLLQGKETSILPEKVEETPWKTIELKPEQKLIGASQKVIINDIKAKGYSLVSAEIRFEVK
ncbi:MAG: hypothetical protein VR65_04440 [Desulfobulbaceae bacterium BRH_c16a]|nr:MAG: hypothetical protein VR65_04440 [Desulfobulbaceae bacterium BRH_c16a]